MAKAKAEKNKKEESKKFSLSETKNWYNDRYQSVLVQRNVLFFITILALGGLILSAFAVAALNNRKTFEPFVIEIEEKTGAVSQINASSLEEYKADEVLMRYFVIKYIRAHENYSASDFGRYVQLIRLMSNAPVYRSFIKEVGTGNEDSPYHLGTNAIRTIDIKSISNIDKRANMIQVRIRKRQIKTQNSAIEWEKHYIITLTYQYINVDFTQNQRLTNPLGFTVTNYSIDRDSGEGDDDKYAK